MAFFFKLFDALMQGSCRGNPRVKASLKLKRPLHCEGFKPGIHAIRPFLVVPHQSVVKMHSECNGFGHVLPLGDGFVIG